MSEPFETMKVKLVTIVAPYRLGDHIAADLWRRGIHDDERGRLG